MQKGAGTRGHEPTTAHERTSGRRRTLLGGRWQKKASRRRQRGIAPAPSCGGSQPSHYCCRHLPAHMGCAPPYLTCSKCRELAMNPDRLCGPPQLVMPILDFPWHPRQVHARHAACATPAPPTCTMICLCVHDAHSIRLNHPETRDRTEESVANREVAAIAGKM